MTIKLIHSYDEHAYPVTSYTPPFADRYDPVDIHRQIEIYQRAIELASISDYKFFTFPNRVEIRFKNANDNWRFQIALNPEEARDVKEYYSAGFGEEAPQELKRVQEKFQKAARKWGLAEKITFDINLEKRSIDLRARDGKSFFDFDQRVRQHYSTYTHGLI